MKQNNNVNKQTKQQEDLVVSRGTSSPRDRFFPGELSLESESSQTAQSPSWLCFAQPVLVTKKKKKTAQKPNLAASLTHLPYISERAITKLVYLVGPHL